MTQVDIGSTVKGQYPPRVTSVVQESSDPGRRLERLAPLVHDLIAWDLVYKSESGTFLLRDDVQTRLREISVQTQSTAPRVYRTTVWTVWRRRRDSPDRKYPRLFAVPSAAHPYRRGWSL